MNRILQLFFFFSKQPWHSSQTGAAKVESHQSARAAFLVSYKDTGKEQCSTTSHLGTHRLYVGVRCVRKHPGNKEASSSHLKLLG